MMFSPVLTESAKDLPPASHEVSRFARLNLSLKKNIHDGI